MPKKKKKKKKKKREKARRGKKGYLSPVTAPGWATDPRPGGSSYGRYAILMVGAPSNLKMQIAARPLVQFRDFDSYPVRLSKIRSGRHQADWLQQGECMSPRLRNGLPQRNHMSKDIRVPFVQPKRSEMSGSQPTPLPS